MGNKVDRVQTNVSEPQLAQAMIEVWREMFGTTPSKEQIAILIAQNSLETGNRKAMWNYNIGNIKAQKDGPYDYFYLVGPEQTSPGKCEKLKMTFRAYPSLKEGVKDYIDLLKGSKRYANAWKHVLNPDPASFSKELKKGGYYTADEAPYTKLLSGIYSKFTNSNSYEQALSGNIAPPTIKQDSSVASNIWSKINTMLDKFLNALAHDYNSHKKYLDKNELLIKVNSNNLFNSIEYSRILCEALEEEMLAKTYVHSDGENVEIECKVYGNPYFCKKAINSFCDDISEAFKCATKKYVKVDVETEIFVNKKSNLDYLNDKLAETSYRMFRLNLLKKQG